MIKSGTINQEKDCAYVPYFIAIGFEMLLNTPDQVHLGLFFLGLTSSGYWWRLFWFWFWSNFTRRPLLLYDNNALTLLSILVKFFTSHSDIFSSFYQVGWLWLPGRIWSKNRFLYLTGKKLRGRKVGNQIYGCLFLKITTQLQIN